MLSRFVDSETAISVVFILAGIALIFVTLTYITKNMRIIIAARIEHSVNAALGRSGLVGMGVGIVVTVLVQSSSITTSILVPIVASGILAVRNAYPITLGANVGTTVTALLAALATGTIDGMTIALVHLLFNLVAIAIIYPWPRVRYIPVTLASFLADIAVKRPAIAIGYVAGAFIVLPIVGIVTLS